jgi:TonB-linked SusC/RagA family outer membrane protein
MTTQALAQDRTVTGVVTDSETGDALIGVSVLVKGTTTGSVTDIDGKYTIKLSDGATTLVFSYIGYTSVEVVPTGSVLDIKLSAGVELEETVVTAFGASKEKKQIGYSVTEIKGEDLVKAGERSAVNALQGKVAGLQISSSGGAPGSSSRFLIRGASTLRGDNEPLIVVDGVPFTNTSRGTSGDQLGGITDNGNMINAINPDDIESVSVLKSAAATAIYGTDGANGVIMITTKKGNNTGGLKKLGISVTHSSTFSTPLKLPTYQSQAGQGWDGLHYLIENGSWGPNFDGADRLYGNIIDNSQLIKPYSFQKNMMKDFFETGTEFSNAISLTGGDDKYSFYGSYSNNLQDGIMPGEYDKYNRNTIALRAAKTSGRIKLSMSMNYSKTKSKFVPGGQTAASGSSSTVYNDLLQIPNDFSIYDMRDYTNKFYSLEGYYTPYSITNPYYTLAAFGNNFNADKFFGSGNLSAEITKWLSFQYRFGFDFYNDDNLIYEPIIALPEDNANAAGINNPGYVSQTRTKNSQINHDFFLNFSHRFLNKVSIDGFLGYNVNEFNSSLLSSTVTSLNIPDFYNVTNSSSIPVVNQTSLKRRKLGAYGQATIGYNSLIYLTYSARNDWSSTLPIDNNSFFYNAISASYVFSNHLKTNKWFNFGKLRASYGTTGNDADAYSIYPFYVQGSATNPFRNIDFPLGGVNAYEVSNQIGNPTLKPEFTKEYEAGLDLVFLDSRLKVDLAYYNKLTSDQIIPLALPVESGYTTIVTNIGDIRNKGIELSISADVLKVKNLTWNIFGTFNNNKNLVESLPDELEKVSLGGLSTLGYFAVEGQPLGVYEGNVPLTTVIDGVEKIVVNPTTGLPVLSPDKEFLGNSQTKFTIGAGTTLSWKGISFNVLFDIRRGGKMFSRTRDIVSFTGNGVNTVYNDRNPFVVPNSVIQLEDGDGGFIYVENDVPVDRKHQDDYYNDNTNPAFNQLIDRSYVKLREMSLRYSIPQKALAKTPFNSISLSIIGRNLFLWTPSNNPYVDPEMTSFGTGLEADFGEFSSTPSTRNFGIGLNLTF